MEEKSGWLYGIKLQLLECLTDQTLHTALQASEKI
jgi:hypothetical protein